MVREQQLESEYCPPIDTALFSAVISDYDLSDDNAALAARATLDAIRASALEQDFAEFDPSGNSTRSVDTSDGTFAESTDVSSNTGASRSDETNVTNLFDGIRSLDVGSRETEYVHDGEVEEMDDTSKVKFLKEMFPGLSEFVISRTVNKYRSSWNRTLEELLNRTFFDEQVSSDGENLIAPKGIDAFSEDNNIRRERRKKQKKHRKAYQDQATIRSTSLPRPASMGTWEKVGRDIEFLKSRVNVSTEVISSTYHKNGASLSATIFALLDVQSEVTVNKICPDTVIRSNALALQENFPSLGLGYLTGLICLTHPSTAAAHELAKVLTSRPTGQDDTYVELIPQYTPITIKDDFEEDTWTSAQERRKARSGISTPSSSSGDPREIANTLLYLQQSSFSQASAAYRRGKSDRLMSAAAGFYSQQGREFASKRAEAIAEAADLLVESQSSNYEIDLHGVSVNDSVRIASAKTETWWREQKTRVMGLDGRVRDEGVTPRPLHIVTGIGRHSVGGRPKIGPAVGKMLITKGWNVIVGEGVLTVYGKK